MSETTGNVPSELQLEAGAYEVIRKRLDQQADVLQDKLNQLNEDRKAIFGGVDFALVSTARLTTEVNGLSQDMVSIGRKRFIFGYNVQVGLRASVSVQDVFSVYDYDVSDHSLHECKLPILGHAQFVEDFDYLYRYYKNASFLKFLRVGPYLYMGMRAGREVREVKVFKWKVLEETGELEYVGNRFDHEFVFPHSQEFAWKRAHRDMYRHGVHPHVSLEDKVFVETVGGDLTIKVDDNTDIGVGIYSEPVENPDQTLDDAEIHYSVVGNLVLIKVLPYQEKHWRHFIFNQRTQEAQRVDSIAEACVLLPDDHGVLFPTGYALQSGEFKFFETGLPPLQFERRISSKNGEDTLFVFTDLVSGTYLLMAYNLIRQGVETPMVCQGFSLFSSGEMLVFQAHEDPRKHHSVQVWQTPVVTEDHETPLAESSFLSKIGNAELVRLMSDCRGVITLLQKNDSFSGLYVELVRAAGNIADAYFWIDRSEAYEIKSVLLAIKSAAESALGEFEKVRRMRKEAQDRTDELGVVLKKTLTASNASTPDDIQTFVGLLTSLRELRGKVMALREVRYIHLSLLDEWDQALVESSDLLSAKCVEFLLRAEALQPYHAQIEHLREEAPKAQKALETTQLDEALQQCSNELELLIGVVSGLKIKDATETTRIVENISSLFAELNQVRAVLRSRREDLLRAEGTAEFQAQLSLLNQSVINYLEICQTPEKCEEALTKVMIQLEELDGRFSEFTDFSIELITKREEIQSAFETKRQALLETKQRRSLAVSQSAERILTSVQNRVMTFLKTEEMLAWIASDPMVAKLRDLVSELREIGDSVKADELQTRLKTLQQDSQKQIRDKSELFVGGGDLIQFGKHHFSVNRQPLELAMLMREGVPYFHLTGSKYYERVEHSELMSLKDVWEWTVKSESDTVYRGEYLAWHWSAQVESLGMEAVKEFSSQNLEAQRAQVRDFMHQRFSEGYTKGVHDHDAAMIASALLEMRMRLGARIHAPAHRALAMIFWDGFPDSELKQKAISRLHALGRLRQAFGFVQDQADLEVLGWLQDTLKNESPSHLEHVNAVYEALLTELSLCQASKSRLPQTMSNGAVELAQQFKKTLHAQRFLSAFDESLQELQNQIWERFRQVQLWLQLVMPLKDHGIALEAAMLLTLGSDLPLGHPIEAPAVVEIHPLMGSHPTIQSGRMEIDYYDFSSRLRAHDQFSVPRFERYQALKHHLIQDRRTQLQLDQFKAGVLTSFVRNRLIDAVYLPIIGANLAKQMGAANDTRTDRMGLLLLISPPGYGKTTLMEYVANRLGITLVKINGPALGHQVTSLDPLDAPNAGAREEVEKLNLALEMGDNVMIYVDDIQHCHAEFLQKFIPLCDGSRKMEGVFQGKAKTYDLRGRKVAVVMAGNPYTEVGGKFQVPDMLANRADTYNLGEILGGNESAFKDSYIENCLTSNLPLSRIASKSHRDAMSVLKIAQTGSRENIDFEASHSAEEINDAVAVMSHLLRIREVVLRVNQEYIRSAATEDAYRTEPSFKLQGSYRNMNKIAEKVLPLMSASEVDEIVLDHYRGESQTLSQAAEANLLKWREINDELSEAEAERWNEIRKTFQRNLLSGGSGEQDPVARLTGHLKSFSMGLEKIEEAVRKAAGHSTLNEETMLRLQNLLEGLRAVPVHVEISVQPVEPAHSSEENASGVHEVLIHKKITQGGD